MLIYFNEMSKFLTAIHHYIPLKNSICTAPVMWVRTTAYPLLKRENRQCQGHTKYVHFNLDIVCFYAIFNKAVYAIYSIPLKINICRQQKADHILRKYSLLFILSAIWLLRRYGIVWLCLIF